MSKSKVMGYWFLVVQIVKAVQIVEIVKVVEIVEVVEVVHHRGQKSEIRDLL